MEQDNFEIYKSTMLKMLRISRLHRMVFEKNISNMGIHHSQHHLLMYIAKAGEITSQKEIAEKFEISPAAIARTLKSLESEGFVVRENLEGDGRYNRITITDKGKQIVENSYKMFQETDSSLFEDFSDDDIVKFNQLLDGIQSKLISKNEEHCCVRKNNEKQTND